MPKEIVMSLADEAQRIGKTLSTDHHTHLLRAEIIYVFTNQTRKRCDRVRIGSAAKLNALQRFLSSGMETVAGGHDFLILIDEFEWRDLTPAQRQALVDHELCHCAAFVKIGGAHSSPDSWRLLQADESVDDFEEWRWGLRGHDVEEFADVLKRHGWWKPDAREKGFGDIALQLAMNDGTKREALKK